MHITSLTSPRRTACNKKCDGWKVPSLGNAQKGVMAAHVTCPDCKAAVFLKVRR